MGMMEAAMALVVVLAGRRHLPFAPVWVREAESIKVAAFPEPLAFLNWKSTLRQEVAAAPSRPDEALKWFQATDRHSFEQLAHPGKLPSLDPNFLGGRGERASRKRPVGTWLARSTSPRRRKPGQVDC